MKKLLILLALLCAASVHATERSSAAKLAFVKLQACPGTALHKLPCPGFVINHKQPLDCAGKDEPANMEWLTVEAAKAEDRWERNDPACKHPTHGVKPE